MVIKYKFEQSLPDYKCDNCKVAQFCSEMTTITDTSNVIIIQLKVFTNICGRTIKFNPDIYIDDNFNLHEKEYKLHGVIYHQGHTAYSGHYICKVQIDDTWLLISDNSIKN